MEELLKVGNKTVSYAEKLGADEGCPRQKTLIIEKGVLHSYLYDNYAAKTRGKREHR